jgi:hypothetical protein
MLQNVVEIANHDTRPHARIDKLQQRRSDAYRDLANAIRQLPAESKLFSYDYACERLVAFWKSRAEQFQRQLRKVLDSDKLTDAQRAQLAEVALTHGKRGVRWRHMLSPEEQRLIDNYRACDADTRHALRTFADRLKGQE